MMNRAVSARMACTAATAIALAACGAAEPHPAPISDLTEIPTPAGPESGEPNLFATDDGRVHMSWIEAGEGETDAVRMATLAPGADSADAWSEPRTIDRSDQFFVNWADFPSIIEMPDGSLAAHWLVRSGPGTYAYDVHIARSFDDGASWTDAVVPHRDGTQTEHGFVSLFPTVEGRLGAVWLDGRKYPEEGGGHSNADGADDPEMTLRFATLDANGRIADATELDGRTCDCCQTSVARTAEGPVLVYRNREGDETRDISITRRIDGRWTEPRPVHEDGWVIPACPVNGPAVAADGRTVAVAWFTAADNSPRVRLAFSEDAGATFGDPVRIDEGAPSGRVDVVMLPDGAALVSWLEEGTAGQAAVRVRRVEPDGRLGRAATVAESRAARSSGFPRMVRTNERLVFAWTVPGDPSEIRAATAKWFEPLEETVTE